MTFPSSGTRSSRFVVAADNPTGPAKPTQVS